MTDKEPNFEDMSIYELLKYDFENPDMEYEDWFTAIEGKYPFEGFYESFAIHTKCIENLGKKLNRLIDALDKTGIKFDVTLKEWMKK